MEKLSVICLGPESIHPSQQKARARERDCDICPDARSQSQCIDLGTLQRSHFHIGGGGDMYCGMIPLCCRWHDSERDDKLKTWIQAGPPRVEVPLVSDDTQVSLPLCELPHASNKKNTQVAKASTERISS